MKPIFVTRRTSTIFNLEKQPLHSLEERNDDRLTSFLNAVYPATMVVMLILITLCIGLFAESLGVEVFGNYLSQAPVEN